MADTGSALSLKEDEEHDKDTDPGGGRPITARVEEYAVSGSSEGDGLVCLAPAAVV